MGELFYLSALELRELYRARAISPVEVTEASLARIEQLNPKLGAFVTVTGDLALQQARTAEVAYARQELDEPLLGVPVSVKDLTATKGIRTTRGSLLYQNWVPTYDPPIMERLYAAGAVLLGKTNTPEFGWKGDSGNRILGPTHNPWRHGVTAGGSSGGAAAAVAAGLGPLAQGSDGAGSIRIPAAFCGVFGFKPSFGLIPHYPASSLDSLSHLGPLTRTVADAALFLDVAVGPDPRDRQSLGPTAAGFLAGLESELGELRVAWSPDLGYARLEPEVKTITEDAARAFEDIGCVVEQASPRAQNPYPVVDIMWTATQAAMHRDNFQAVRDLLDPGRVALIERGWQTRGVDLAAANIQRAEYYEKVRLFMESYDLFITPTLPLSGFPAGADRPWDQTGELSGPLEWSPFTYPFNLTGQPAATVPCGWTRDGLPVGLQIVGKWRADEVVLRAARAFEQVRPWRGRVPPLETHAEQGKWSTKSV